MRIDVLGVGFDDVTLPEAVEKGMAFMAGTGCHYVVTPNPELVQRAKAEPEFATALNGADMVLPDGIGIIYGAKILKRPLKGRCPGIDFASGLLAEMAKQGKSVFLFGANPGVAEQASKNLVATYPGLVIAGHQDGYVQDHQAVAETIAQSGADVVFVCLGAPKQEYFMVEHGTLTGAKLLVGLGGSLDVFAGVVERAPESWQKLGLEWLYRLTKEPKRIGRMAKLPLFLVSALGAAIRGK